ncbi:MAG: polysaccharide biosynthesis tyrosine autokinase [Prevotellaceae bacterium]|jgi:capsular exopolysaccharide synthesis family protein|nr:polysaccharide biosynthesis tyrosine autokinase [Prevotellaceae bacterium]
MISSPDELYTAATSDDSTVDVRKIILKYVAYWKWFVVSFIALVLLGLGYLFMATPLYEINASILIKDDKKLGGNSGAMSMLEELDLFSSKKVVENEIEILRSYTLLEEVVKDLNLNVQYTIKDGLRTKMLYGDAPVKIEVVTPTEALFETPLILRFEAQRIVINEQSYPQNALVTEPFGSLRVTVNDSLLARWDAEKTITVTFIPVAKMVEALRDQLDVAISAKGTSVINLSLLSPIPERGKDVLNHLIAVYNKAAIADKNNLAGVTLKFIDERLKLVAVDLQDAEENVERYKSAQGITNISTESELFLQTVQQNDLELSKVTIQLDVLRHIEQYVLSDAGRGTTPATLGLNDPTLLSLIKSLTETEAERTLRLQALEPAHPMIQSLNDQIKILKGNIIDNIKILRSSLESMQKNLQAENRRIEIIIQSVPRKERELVDITRQKEIKNQLYVYLLSKREETAISYASTVADSRIIDVARHSLYPVQPKKKIVLLIFGLIGLLLPAGILWLIELFDDKISTKDEIERNLKTPVLGEISFVEQANKLLSLTASRSKHAEQIRTLRTNLTFMQAGGGIRIIMITSSVSGEGKSFLTANLGIALAALNKKVVVLGFDLRKPGLHKIFGIDNEDGLSNYLSGQVTLRQIIQNTDQSENLHIISCGHISPNPQELLQGETLPQLFEELKQEYDYIVVDTPPVGLVSDALLINCYADVTIYVVRQNYTPKERIKFINDLYHVKRLKNIGVVINGIKEEKWHGYTYGHYKYYGKYYTNSVTG